jgi:predicted ATPase
LRITVTNIGPIKKADIDLKPLVVFVGPNNTGKSLLATVLHVALTRHNGPRLRLSAEDADLLSAAIDSPGELPQRVRTLVDEALNETLEHYTARLPQGFSRAAGMPVTELVNKARKRGSIASIEVSSLYPAWRVRIRIGARVAATVEDSPNPLEAWSAISRNRLHEILSSSSLVRSSRFRSAVAAACFREAPRRSWYLPAARTGFMQSYKVLAATLIRGASYDESEEVGTPGISGVIADFVGELLELDSSELAPYAEEADRLEHEVLHGQIALLAGAPTDDIVYRTQEGDYPLSRTSSMISELAPIVLYLRYILRADDLLIIEEPEAHLHPGAQVAFARCLVRLVNRGLRVLLTTHSEFFLQQLSNAIVAGSLQAGPRNPEALEASQVAAYFFDPSDTGTTVTELPVDTKNGITEESFSAVSEQLYNEAVYLDRSRSAEAE